MKVILNKCFGGFHPSAEAYKLYAHKKGIELYPYETGLQNYKRITWETAIKNGSLWVSYFTKDFGENPVISDAEYVEYDLYMRDNKWREDPILVEVVEELGKRASSPVSHLVVVEIPDGLDYVIDDYDGFETLHERVEEW